MWMLGLVVVAIIVLVIVVAMVRKALGSEKQSFGSDDGFAIIALRQMLRAGQITDEEYEHAKATVVAQGLKKLHGDKIVPRRAAGRTSMRFSDDGHGEADRPSNDSDNEGK
jgi:hypothetical protein